MPRRRALLVIGVADSSEGLEKYVCCIFLRPVLLSPGTPVAFLGRHYGEDRSGREEREELCHYGQGPRGPPIPPGVVCFLNFEWGGVCQNFAS